MVVTVGEYAFEEAAPPPAPRPDTEERRPAPDMERIRQALRREAERAQRMWAD